MSAVGQLKKVWKRYSGEMVVLASREVENSTSEIIPTINLTLLPPSVLWMKTVTGQTYNSIMYHHL